MISLLAPLGLAALASLAIPLLIHLMRDPREPPVSFAALRWVPRRDRAQTQRRLHERVLLCLRLLLLASLALLLAAPVWRGAAGDAPPWVVVAAGVDAQTARRAVDAAPDAQWRRLAPGFPPLEQSTADGKDFASLLRQLDAELPSGTKLAVIVPAVLGGLDAERLKLGREVAWHIVPGRSPASGSTVPDRAAAQLVSPLHAKTPIAGPRRALDPVLAWIAALLFAAERLWASRRKSA